MSLNARSKREIRSESFTGSSHSYLLVIRFCVAFARILLFHRRLKGILLAFIAVSFFFFRPANGNVGRAQSARGPFRRRSNRKQNIPTRRRRTRHRETRANDRCRSRANGHDRTNVVPAHDAPSPHDNRVGTDHRRVYGSVPPMHRHDLRNST